LATPFLLDPLSQEAGKPALRQASAYLRRLGFLDAAALRHGDGYLLPVRCGAGRLRGLL